MRDTTWALPLSLLPPPAWPCEGVVSLQGRGAEGKLGVGVSGRDGARGGQAAGRLLAASKQSRPGWGAGISVKPPLSPQQQQSHLALPVLDVADRSIKGGGDSGILCCLHSQAADVSGALSCCGLVGVGRGIWAVAAQQPAGGGW